MGKGTYFQAWWSDFDNPHGGSRELVLVSCPLTSIYKPWSKHRHRHRHGHRHIHRHIHTSTSTHTINERKNSKHACFYHSHKMISLICNTKSFLLIREEKKEVLGHTQHCWEQRKIDIRLLALLTREKLGNSCKRKCIHPFPLQLCFLSFIPEAINYTRMSIKVGCFLMTKYWKRKLSKLNISI